MVMEGTKRRLPKRRHEEEIWGTTRPGRRMSMRRIEKNDLRIADGYAASKSEEEGRTRGCGCGWIDELEELQEG